jgi:origin recognition complex subunit 3
LAALAAAAAATGRGANLTRCAPRPVVIVIEDTEGFDSRVLSDMLLALSDAADTLPVVGLRSRFRV